MQRGTEPDRTGVRKPRRGRPLALHLGKLCVALLVPTLALEAFLLVHIAHVERARHEADAREAARHIAASLDRSLTTAQAVLALLATLDRLRAGDLQAFYRRALEVPLPDRDGELVLRDMTGRQLLSTRFPWGFRLPDHPGTDADQLALTTGRPQVSGPFSNSTDPHSAFAVVAPVLGPNGQAVYLLNLQLPAEAFAAMLRKELLPPGMLASIVDRRGSILATSAAEPGLVHAPLPPDTWTQIEGREEGWLRAMDGAGTSTVMAFARSGAAGWTAVVSLPEAAFAAPLRRSLWTAAGLGALLILLATALAFVFARRIARPIAALADFAVNGGEPALETMVREVNDVSRALAAAREEVRRREGEREDLLQTLDRAQVLVRDPEGHIEVWTAGKARLYGWSRSEALGRVSHELLRTEFPRAREEIEAELLARGEWRGELRQRRRDGAPVIVASHWALRRGPDGKPLAIVEACNDITALRQAEEELRHSRDLLASVVNGSADPIFAKDLEGRYVILNPPAAALLGVPVEAALGRRAADIAGSEGAAPLETVDREVIDCCETRVVENEVGTGDQRRFLLTTKSPWRDAAGRTLGVVGVSRDITARRHAEARLQETQAALFHADRLNAMGAMAAGLAHELNQPLTVVANFAEAARRFLATGPVPDPDRLDLAREAMQEAARQAVHAGDIVRRLRAFVSRSDGEKRPTDVNELVRTASRLALIGAPEQGTALRLELDPALPQILADQVQLQQVVVNLVRNAVEALREAPRREVTVTTSAGASGMIALEVADTGPGLPADVAGRIFEPFVTTKREGMGVGLSICQSIVAEHGGSLEAAPRPGGGTVFRAVLPALRRDLPDGATDAS